MDELVLRVVARFKAGFKYEPKETKQHRVDRIWRLIREQTGLSRGVSEDVADAFVRGRDLDALAYQKNWPMEDGVLTGPSGSVNVRQLATV